MVSFHVRKIPSSAFPLALLPCWVFLLSSKSQKLQESLAIMQLIIPCVAIAA